MLKSGEQEKGLEGWDAERAEPPKGAEATEPLESTDTKTERQNQNAKGCNGLSTLTFLHSQM